MMRAHCVDDGHGAVGHGVELIEAAGLEAAGHEQHVRACSEAVRQAHVEAHPAAALVVPGRLHLPACRPSLSRAVLGVFWLSGSGVFFTHVMRCRRPTLKPTQPRHWQNGFDPISLHA